MGLGAPERVASRRVVSRGPAAVGKASRRRANTTAKHTGDTPSQAPLTRWAWPLLSPQVPCLLGQTAVVGQVSPLRWHLALRLPSWQSARHGASIKTTKAETTCWELEGRMRLMGRPYALGPQRRQTVGWKKKRARSLLTLVRHFQAWAEQWRHGILQAELALRRLLVRACAMAARLAIKAARKRRTTAPILRESLEQHHASVEVADVVHA